MQRDTRPQALLRFADRTCGKYLIWCVERGQWWRPGGYGYTEDLSQAGLFSVRQAKKYVDQANRVSEQYADIAVCADIIKYAPGLFAR